MYDNRIKNNSRFMATLALLTAATIAFEMLGLPQPITGPVVNMMLFLTTLLLNSTAGVLLGCITPLMALLRGQLPPPLLPMVPFIMLANAGLVLVFRIVRRSVTMRQRYKTNYILAVVLASAIKFVILYSAVEILLPAFIGKSLPRPFVLAMSFPQLITAITGGVLAFLIYRVIKKSSAIST
ncbi:ECF transporter S component [candidate division KSB1 bacterium]|nr:ECF transporter S component [candidate division KSB1 bacterium]